MNAEMNATWRKMVGTALLWVAFSALVYVPSSVGDNRTVAIAVMGFLAFCSGLALFANGLKRDIVHALRREREEPRQAAGRGAPHS